MSRVAARLARFVGRPRGVGMRLGFVCRGIMGSAPGSTARSALTRQESAKRAPVFFFPAVFPSINGSGGRNERERRSRVASSPTVALALIGARAAPRGRVDRRGGRPRASLGAMPLTQITDVFDEPLDLWLSRNHEGQRRYVRADALASAGASGAAPPAGPATEPPRTPTRRKRLLPPTPSLPAAPDDAGALCQFIPDAGAAVPSWLSVRRASPALPDVDDARGGAPRVPLPAPVGLIGQIPPVPSVIPDPVERARRVAAEEAARVFPPRLASPPSSSVAHPPTSRAASAATSSSTPSSPTTASRTVDDASPARPPTTTPAPSARKTSRPITRLARKSPRLSCSAATDSRFSTTPTASIDGSTTPRDASSPSRTNLAPRTRTSAGTRARRVAFPGWAAASIVVRRSCFAESAVASPACPYRLGDALRGCAGRCNTTEKRSTWPGASFEPRSVPTDADGAVVARR